MTALDHRGSRQRMIDSQHPEAVVAARLTGYKLDLNRALAPVSSTVLLDPVYGDRAAQDIASGALPRDKGLLVGAQATKYNDDHGTRHTEFLPGWSVQRVPRMGADAAKLLVSSRPGREDAAALQREVAEFPTDPRFEQDEGRMREASSAPHALPSAPWILLWGGVPFEVPACQVQIAAQDGASGFLARRAAWQETMGAWDGRARQHWLGTVGTGRVRQLADLAGAFGRPSWRRWGAEPGRHVSGDEPWYARSGAKGAEVGPEPVAPHARHTSGAPAAARQVARTSGRTQTGNPVFSAASAARPGQLGPAAQAGFGWHATSGILEREDSMTVSTGKVRVAVNGYGVIGKRVADAVSAQDDMELVGVADVVSDYRIRVAVERGYPVYTSVPERSGEMQAAGVPVAGTLQELLAQVEVVVDCAPKKVAAANQAAYRAAGVKAIWQGGEKHELAGYSFVAQVNYAGALNRDSARVVSCNTTALSRISHALHGRGLARRVRAVLMRRATDPWESHRNGMINTAIPETKVPSHQGPDAQTVIPGLDITTLAGAGPYNLSHLHFAMIETTRPVDVDELRAILLDTPRVALVRAADGLEALNSVMELMRDLRRPRGDMWEVAVWEDALASDGREVYLTFQVHNEAIVIPENVDCIRALSGLEPDAAVSIAKTDASLGITRHFLPSTRPPHVTPGEGTPAGFKGAEEPTAPGDG